MGLPRRPIGELLVVMLGEQPDDRSSKRATSHIGESLTVDHVVTMAGAQQLQEIEPAFRTGRAKPSEAVLPIWVQLPFTALCRAPVSSTVIKAAVSSPARNTSRASSRN
jgi:hypothetical protein